MSRETMPPRVRLIQRNWLQLKFDVQPEQIGLSPKFFDRYLAGRKLTVVGTDDFHYLVQDPSNKSGDPIMIHTNHIIK
jgi:hypothetical protein